MIEIKDVKAFSTAMASVARVANSPTMPILSMARFTMRGGTLTVSGTDLEQMIALDIPAAGEDDDFLAPARELAKFSGSIKTGPIKIRVDKNRVNASAGRARARMNGLPLADYPQIEADFSQNVDSLEIEAAVLLEAIQGVTHAAGQQDVRYFLNGVLMDRSGHDGVNLVATDGHRLAHRKIKMGMPESRPTQRADRESIIPNGAIASIERALKGAEDDEDVLVEATARHIRFTVPGAKVLTGLIDGAFPEWARVMDAQGKTGTVTIDKESLEGVLSRASIFCANRHEPAIAMSVDGDDLQVEVVLKHEDGNEFTEAVMGDVEGAGHIRFGVNLRYVQEAVAALDAETIVLTMPERDCGLLVHSDEVEGARNLIMPMRL